MISLAGFGFLLACVFGAIALLVATVSGKRAAAIGAGVGLALAAFLLNVLAPMADWLQSWQNASPFHWALGEDPLLNGVALGMAGLMLVVTLAVGAAAVIAYQRRDIEGR